MQPNEHKLGLQFIALFNEMWLCTNTSRHSLKVYSTKFGNFLYVAFSKITFLEHTGDDIDSGKSIKFPFLISLIKCAQWAGGSLQCCKYSKELGSCTVPRTYL